MTTIESPMDLRTELLARVPDYATPAGYRSSSSPDYLMPELCEETPVYRRFWLGIALAILALYAVVVFSYWGPADSGVDQNAYLVGGRMLAQHGSMKYTLPNPYSYTGGMYVRVTPVDAEGNPVPGGDYFPKYPFGLPLLYACFFWAFKVASILPIIGHHVNPNQAAYWAFLVSPVSAVLGVAGTFFLARQVAGSFAASLAAILLASSQLMMMLADNPNSHESCLAFIVWGMFFCVRWLQTGSHWRGILGGLLVGYAATIRYNEGLLFASMCVVVLGRLNWNELKTWRSFGVAVSVAVVIGATQLQPGHYVGPDLKPLLIGVFSLCGLVGLVFCVLKLELADWMLYLRALIPGLAWSIPVGALLLVNHHTMGSFTGYDSTHESEFGAAFQWIFFFQNWEKVLRIVYDMGLFFVLPFAIAGIFMLFKRSWRVAMMLILWIVPGMMLYMSYYWSPDFADAYARFFLTYLPAFCVGAAVCIYEGVLAGRKAVDRFEGVAAKVAMVTALAWLVPGMIVCAFEFLHTGRSDFMLQLPLVFVPAAVAVAAVLVHEVPLMIQGNQYRFGNMALTVSAAVVVAIASGISMFRTIHGLREGTQSQRIPLHDFRDRLALAQTGQVLMDKVPDKSVLFAEDAGGIATPANYIQFLKDWEMYSVDAFTVTGSRRGMGGGGGNRQRNNGNNNNFNNRRGGGGGGGNFGGGNGGGRGNFGGPGGGGPGGGGPGGGGPGGGNFGGPPGGGFVVVNGNGQNDTTTTDVARPTQPEQQDYHASLYRGKSARQLYQLEADVINKAFAENRKVFVVVAEDHPTNEQNNNTPFGRLFSNNNVNVATNPMESFEENLHELGGNPAKLQYKVVARWQDVSLPEEKDEDFTLTDNNPMGGAGGGGGPRGGGGNQFARMLMGSDQVRDWQLVEITAPVAK